MVERGLEVDHTTIYRWVQHYAPEMEKRLRWYWKPVMDYSWKVDETYVKVKGKWTYLGSVQDYLGHRDSKYTIRYKRVTSIRFEGLWRNDLTALWPFIQL